MVRHLVMWKYNENLTEDDKRALVDRLGKAADNMNGCIKGLISAELDVSVNPAEPHDLALYCEFETLGDALDYQTDPVHLAFKAELSGNVHDRVAIDCEKA